MRNSFTKSIGWLWSNFEEILILFFFTTFTFNIRKVFLKEYSFLNGTYNDFLTPSIRLSDIVIIVTIIIITIKYLIRQYKNEVKSFGIIENKYNIMSRFIAYLSNLKISRETLLLIIFWLWLLFSIAWSPFKNIALYKAFYFSEILLFFVIVYYFALNKALDYKHIYLAIIASGTIESIIAVSQFVKNGALGLKIFGESIIGPNITGVAKITIFGVKHIRAYGTFPHPNVLAGFLIIPIFIVSDVLFRRIKKSLQNSNAVSHETLYTLQSISALTIILFILLSGFILTFSRSAYIGLIIGLLLYFLKNLKLKELYIKHILIFSALLILIVSSLLFVSRITPNSLFSSQSLEERSLYQEVSREIIYEHPFGGAGIGQFVFEESRLHETFQGWQYQPVHNVYLLIGSELGLFGLIFYLILIMFLLHNFKNRSFWLILTNVNIYIIVCFLFISFFDHYFWDLEQGLIIFIIPFLFFLLSKRLITASNN